MTIRQHTQEVEKSSRGSWLNRRCRVWEWGRRKRQPRWNSQEEVVGRNFCNCFIERRWFLRLLLWFWLNQEVIQREWDFTCNQFPPVWLFTHPFWKDCNDDVLINPKIISDSLFYFVHIHRIRNGSGDDLLVLLVCTVETKIVSSGSSCLKIEVNDGGRHRLNG